MTELSSQITSIMSGGDDGWGVLYRAREKQARGEDVVMLAMGDHDFPTAEPVIDACKIALDAGRTGYGSIQGMVPLREEIARRAAGAHGFTPDIDDIVIAVGGQAALYAACCVTLDAGSEAIVVEPYYATYAQTVRAAGGRPVIVGARPEAGFQPDAANIEAAITPATRTLLLNTPNNPSGTVYSRDTLEAVADVCRRHDLWLISDEVYHTQVHEGRHLSPVSLPGMRERSFIVDSMSKSHAMTGWRAGWLICPDRDAAERLADLFLVTAYGLPPFIQLAMRAALAMGIEPEHEIALRYRLRRDIAVAALSQSERLRVIAPAAAMYVLLDLRGFESDGNRFAMALLDETGIAAMPGESFGASSAGHLRISLTAPDHVLGDACTRIAGFADQWSHA